MATDSNWGWWLPITQRLQKHMMFMPFQGEESLQDVQVIS